MLSRICCFPSNSKDFSLRTHSASHLLLPGGGRGIGSLGEREYLRLDINVNGKINQADIAQTRARRAQAEL